MNGVKCNLGDSVFRMKGIFRQPVPAVLTTAKRSTQREDQEHSLSRGTLTATRGEVAVVPLSPWGLCKKVPKRSPRRQLDIVKPTYQPSKAELSEDVRVDAMFEEAVDALTRPVEINYVPRPARRDRPWRFGTFLHNPQKNNAIKNSPFLTVLSPPLLG